MFVNTKIVKKEFFNGFHLKAAPPYSFVHNFSSSIMELLYLFSILLKIPDISTAIQLFIVLFVFLCFLCSFVHLKCLLFPCYINSDTNVYRFICFLMFSQSFVCLRWLFSPIVTFSVFLVAQCLLLYFSEWR